MIALPSKGGRRQVGSIRLQHDMLQADLIEESVYLPVLKGHYPTDPEFHIESYSPECLLIRPREAMEDAVEIISLFLFQYFEDLIKGFPAVDHDGQAQFFGHGDLFLKSHPLLGKERLVPIEVYPGLPYSPEFPLGQEMADMVQFFPEVLFHVGGMQSGHQKNLPGEVSFQLKHGLRVGRIDGRDKESFYPLGHRLFNHLGPVLVESLGVEVNVCVRDLHVTKIGLSLAQNTGMGSIKSFLKKRKYKPVPLTLTATHHLELTAAINGISGRFILDTGASNTCVGVDKMEVFKLNSEASEVKAAGAGATDMETQLSTENTLQIGHWKKKKIKIILFDLSHINEALTSHEALPVDGIIGADVLEKGKAVIDYKSGTLYLKKKKRS